MALARNDALSLYGGGPRQHRPRSFCTVREPAKGFFIAGSSILDLNGIYGPANRSAVATMIGRQPLLAYRNDETGWLLALVDGKPEPRRRRPLHTASRRCYGLRDASSDSDSDSSSDARACQRREWRFVDVLGEERFSHKGDTVIPGSGTRWHHIQKSAAEMAAAAAAEASLWQDCREDPFESAAEEEEDEDKDSEAWQEPPRSFAPASNSALAAFGKCDENELPWQVIAVLDASVLQDLRRAFRRYKHHIAVTVAGGNLPTPGPQSLEECSKPGRWVFRAVTRAGAELRSGPSAMARLRGRVPHGSCVCGLQLKGPWLRVEPFEGKAEGDGSDCSEWWARLEDKSGNALLAEVAETDSACLHMPRDDALEAEIFDRPFEPRLRGADETATDEPEEDKSPVGIMANIDKPDVPSPPLSWQQLQVGSAVTIEGLVDDRHNGATASVISLPSSGHGRCAVQLMESREMLSVKALNIRLILARDGGELDRATRILGTTLADLGLAVHSDDGAVMAGREMLDAAWRAAHRDTLGAKAAASEVDRAYGILVAKLAEQSAASNTEPAAGSQNVTAPIPPHIRVENGALGSRAALAARAAGSNTSLSEMEEGIDGLRQILCDEKQRAAEAVGQRWPPGAADLHLAPAESNDALQLRLCVVRGLLRCRREREALRDSESAENASRGQPWAAAATFWVARCLLRQARREEGVRALERAAESDTNGNPDGEWGRNGAAAQLKSLRFAERCQRRAEDAYAYGDFETAVTRHGEALDIWPHDDRWGRAACFARRAACHRRARNFQKAIDDCDAALLLFPRYARALFRRGSCLLEAGRAAEAVQAFESLLRVDRNWPGIFECLLRAHAQRQRAERKNPFGAAKGRRRVVGKGDDGLSNGKEVPNYYSVLEVTTDATERQLKRAYRLMSLKYHPDKPGGSATDFQLVADAYQTLSDADKRRAYDEGADVQRKRNPDESSDSQEETVSLRKEVERKYFPERFHFWPFGDPFIEKRKMERRTGRMKPAYEDDDQ